ncbi:MAG TPA: HDOD domain-containing protein [Rhodothermales bacterium]
MSGFIPATRFEQSPILEIRFPPMPRTVTEVSHLLAEQNQVPDTSRLVEVVNEDPVVAVSVLRRINSAYYGMRRRVGDIQKAVFLLGFLEVCNIVLTAGMMKMRDVLHSEEQAHIFEKIMQMSIGAAHYAQELCLYLQMPNRSTSFTAGLLHAVGRLVLLYNKPHDYEALWCTGANGNPPTIEDERLIFGTDHAQLGALAADRWHLPADLVHVIGHHPNPSQIEDADLRDLARAVLIGSLAVQQLDMVDGAERKFEDNGAVAALAAARGADAASLVELLESSCPFAFDYFEQASVE